MRSGMCEAVRGPWLVTYQPLPTQATDIDHV